MGVRLRLGPILRRVTPTTASIWVETDAPATVAVTAGRAEHRRSAQARTFAVHGHHYAVVELDGLEPGATASYDVKLNDRTVWPPPDSPRPPSRIRTPAPQAPARIVFGSCRIPDDGSAGQEADLGIDMLRAYALRLARRRAAGDDGEEPDLLLLLGDQVYADVVQPPMREFLHRRRGEGDEARRRAEPPQDEVVFFDEYAELYRQAWSVPEVRWLLSTVPTLMLFDDHDIRDDWNTSGAWRRAMEAEPWWRHRVTSGLAAYWIYQHAGNLPPEERAQDPVWTSLRNSPGDAGEALDVFAWRAYREPSAYRWSLRVDLAGSRIVLVDTRCGRIVDDDSRRSMLPPEEAAWLDGQITGDVDHLVVAATLPFLLPRGVHHLEAWNEAVCAGRWSRALRGPGETLRQKMDLEHWAAFGASFRAVARAVGQAATGRRGAPPASVLFLGGDVHFSYLARAHLRDRSAQVSTVAQLVCSPMRNTLPGVLRAAARLSFGPLAAFGARALAMLAGVRAPELRWRVEEGPHYDNALATLVLDGRAAEAVWERPAAPGEGGAGAVEPFMRHRLAPPPGG